MEDFEQKELKRRKEDFRVEIRKNKQAKTFSANRKKLIQRLFEEEETTSSSSTSSQEKQNVNCSPANNMQNIFNISSFDNKASQAFNQQNSFSIVPLGLSSSNSLKVYLIYSLQEIGQLVVEFVDYISKSSQLLAQSASQEVCLDTPNQTDLLVAQNLLKEVLQPLLKYEDLFKQISDKNCYLFEQSQVHIRLFKYLQNIINSMQFAMSLDLQGAEALLCKVFQYLVNVCLNSEKALDDCFSLGIINYFINVMISSNFYKQKSKMILFSVNLLDHIASRNNSEHIKVLAEKEITRQILTLMKDVQKSILESQQNQQFGNILSQENMELKMEGFYRRLLVHLSSILSNISSNKELIDQSDKNMLIQICQELLVIICKDLNEKCKQATILQKFYQTMPNQQSNQGMKSNLEEEEEEEELSDMGSLQKKISLRPADEQKNFEELTSIEENLGASLLNIIEMMEADDLDEYISNNITFLVFSQSQILPIEDQNLENSQRIQIYGELMNGLLMGEEEQIELVIETFQILDYIKNLIYSNYNNLVITGLICLYDILISATSTQFDLIYEHDKNIICRLLHLINNYSNNTQIQIESIKTLSAFVDRAPKPVIDFTLRPTNIINMIIQKMDPENDPVVIKSSLSLLESLLKSEDDNRDDDDNEEFDEEQEEIEEVNHNSRNHAHSLKHTGDNYWALKFQSNPAGNNMITKLFNSLHSKDIILQLNSILDEYID